MNDSHQDTRQKSDSNIENGVPEVEEHDGFIPEVNVEIEEESRHVIYRIQDSPPLLMWPVYGLQQTFICIASALTVPFLISNYICAGHLPEVRAQLLSITFFMCGVATLLQTSLGIRLPIVQGSAYAYLPPIVAMMQLEQWRCPDPDQELGEGEEEPWIIRLREIQGNLMLGSLVHMLLGVTGVVGFLLRFIGPVTIAPTITLIGIGFTAAVNTFADKQWGIAMMTVVLVLVFSLWLGHLKVPLPSYSKDKGCHFSPFPVFVVISMLLGIVCAWLFCLILTEADVLPSNSTEPGYGARTDINLKVLHDAPWFQFPYPWQFGMPTVSLAGFFGMFVAAISSILESLGDYYAAAKVSCAPSPPPHAVNRGIAIEGFSSIIAGMVGAGHATTSYSTNIAAIAVTRVASRRVFQVTGLILILMGVLTKIGAIMTLIPDPIIGGLNAVLLGTLIGIALATLRYVDMESPRNVTVIGLTIMLGLAVPQWVNAEPGRIKTGNDKADQVLTVLLGTPMFVGGLLGAFLDNIAPGTEEERGIAKYQQAMTSADSVAMSEQARDDRQKELQATYDLPFVSNFMRRLRCCAFVPFLPSFNKVK